MVVLSQEQPDLLVWTALFQTPNQVHFAPFFRKRTFVPDKHDLQSCGNILGYAGKCVLNKLCSKVEKIVVTSTLSNLQRMFHSHQAQDKGCQGQTEAERICAQELPTTAS
ncbi:unnamed protein product [Cylindrotheca closterium]|uniref:Uncharacterized protein n=1 Tax=Cylindrotheca closterium TaxID=2856 RepID=A0AAD2CD03_9STRA|nr:unnamed protein product [Cylindrotheca closterium]